VSHFGVTLSADELLAHYLDGYAQDEFSPMSELMTYVVPFEVQDSIMSRLVAWLLFIDGFYPPNGATAGGVAGTAGAGGQGTGAAQWGANPVPVTTLITLPYSMDPQDFPLVIAHLMITAGQVRIAVTPEGPQIHEGHGGAGQPVAFGARITRPAAEFISPITGARLLPQGPYSTSLEGTAINWTATGPWEEHGAFTTPLGIGVIGQTGDTQVFAPRREAADGRGHVVTDGAELLVEVDATHVLERMYDVDVGTLRGLIGESKATGRAYANLQRHVSNAMHVSIKWEYSVGIGAGFSEAERTGVDEFVGDLARMQDGTWRGTVTGTSAASSNLTIFGEECHTQWSGSQQVQITARSGDYGQIPGVPGADLNYLLEIVPVSEPKYLSYPECYVEPVPRRGVKWLVYNDASITHGGVKVRLLPPDGGSWGTPLPVLREGDHVTLTVDVTYISP
jgi:hypothetical protein